MPWNSFNMISRPKKQGLTPFITFNDPALVTTTTITSGGVSYRVFEIKGNSSPGSTAISTSATLFNTANTTIYYLVVGGGGGSGIAATWNAQGGGGAGRLMEGNRIASGNTSNQTITFSVGSGGTASSNGNQSRVVFPSSYSIVAGGGGGAGTNAPACTASTIGGVGCGGGTNATTNNRNWLYTWGTGYTNGGGGREITDNGTRGYSGGGGGMSGTGGHGGDNNNHGAGGPFAAVSASTKGIYELFTNTAYYSSNELCGGGSGQTVDGAKTLAKGPLSKGQYGAGGSSGYPTTPEVVGQRGIIAIAISVNDIPP
jgi:hypothetical protein